MDNTKHIWEGWTVQDFIEHLELTFEYQNFTSKEDLKKWCQSEQPYYKKHIPEVFNYSCEKTSL